jgi:hypothetical protein
MSIKEQVLRPNLNIIAEDGNTPYDQALNLHNYYIQQRKIPQRELSDSLHIKLDKEIFDSTAETLQVYHKEPAIISRRTTFARLTVVTQSFFYLIFLILLSTGIDTDCIYSNIM